MATTPRKVRIALSIIVLGSLSVLGYACKPEAGQICKPSDRSCVDPQTALQCQKGKFVPSPCKGPKGCTDDGCDFSGNAEGDSCSTDLNGIQACATDKKNAIMCSEGHYRLLPCRGPGGCKPTMVKLKSGDTVESTTEVDCDETIGEAGDLCLSDQFYACSSDKKSMLGCKNDKLEKQYECSGPKGCQPSQDGRPKCDQGLAKVGDPCVSGNACSADGKNVLVCRAAVVDGGLSTGVLKFDVAQECKKGACKDKDGKGNYDCVDPDAKPAVAPK